MRNTIFLDGSTIGMSTGGSLLKSLQRKSADGNLSYQEILESIKEYDSKNNAQDKSTENMTLAEYKEYISARLAALPRHETKKNDIVIVDITDAGFEAMKNNPDYEEWVIGTTAQDLSTNNPLSSLTGGRYCIHRFGDDKEDYSTENWGKARDVTDIAAMITAAQDNFWRGESKLAKRLANEQMAFMREQQLNQIMRQIINLSQQKTADAINNINSAIKKYS